MILSVEVPDRVIEYLDVVSSAGIGKTREELAAHLIEQGVWRMCGDNMGSAHEITGVCVSSPASETISRAKTADDHSSPITDHNEPPHTDADWPQDEPPDLFA